MPQSASYLGFIRPTKTEILERSFNEVNAQFPDIDSRLRWSAVNVLTKSLAGQMHELYGFLEWAARQTNILFCEDAQLDAYGFIYGVDRKAATIASGTITATRTGTLLTNTIYQTTDGRQYKVTADTPVSGSTPVPVESVEQGVQYNLSAGTQLSLASPVAGINDPSSVVTMVGGGDVETDDSYRVRVLAVKRYLPMGGKSDDYAQWSLQVPNVTRSFVFPLEQGPGTIVVRFMMGELYSDGIPLAGDVTSMFNYIETKRPVTASVSVQAPVAHTINLTIDNLTPDTAAIRTAITEEVKAMLRRVAEPDSVLFLSQIHEALVATNGVETYTLTVPATDTVILPIEIPVLGVITYV
jgi:uncharacterized phage protein gp47/JayE